MADNTARRMWQLFEPVHDLVYFTPQARAALDRTGTRGYWMGYFGGRLAPLGPVGAGIATAACFGFHPDRVARAVPDAWRYATPQALLEARLEGPVEVLRGVVAAVGMPDEHLSEAADLLWRAAQSADATGRVLGAANQALPAPADPLARLWQAATTLREHRGDGHIACLIAAGITPVEAHLLKIAAGETDEAALRASRGWPEHAWASGRQRLRERGWLAGDVALTGAGRHARGGVEAATDAAAASAWAALSGPDVDRLAALLHPLVEHIYDSGLVPPSNPTGAARRAAAPAPDAAASARDSAASSDQAR